MTSTQIKPAEDEGVDTDALDAAVTRTAEPTDDKAQAFMDAVEQEKAEREEAELKAYKRQVRIEALKAAQEMNWCDNGTNERLRKLGLREKGQGVPIRVRIEAVRETIITVDADDEEEARLILAQEPTLVTKGQLVTRGWTVTNAENIPDRAPDEPYEIGQPDDTVYVMHLTGDYSVPMCEKYNSRHGYCTLARGHDSHWHAVGDGTAIKGAWKRTDIDD